MQVILDISANTHQNDEKYYRRMIDNIAFQDNRKHEIVIKGQLFRKAGKNIPQDIALLERMARWTYATYGYKTTASVFDKLSLDLLLLMDIPYELPFIKIANNRALDWLIGEIPRKIGVYRSVDKFLDRYLAGLPGLTNLACISKYPATLEDYDELFRTYHDGPVKISDHTIGLDLVKKYKPKIWEKHFRLEDSTGLDAGPWAVDPATLKEVLDII